MCLLPHFLWRRKMSGDKFPDPAYWNNEYHNNSLLLFLTRALNTTWIQYCLIITRGFKCWSWKVDHMFAPASRTISVNRPLSHVSLTPTSISDELREGMGDWGMKLYSSVNGGFVLNWLYTLLSPGREYWLKVCLFLCVAIYLCGYIHYLYV